MRMMILVALMAAAAPARALDAQVGVAAAQFLQIGGGARSLGMGEAYTAVADGPDAAYWNPAGLSRMSRPEVTYARTELPAGIHHDFLAAGMPSEYPSGVIAIAVTRLSQNSLAMVNASNQPQGRFSPHSEVYDLSYGHAFGVAETAPRSNSYFRERWNVKRESRAQGDDEATWDGETAAGLSAKFIHEDLGTRSASAFAVDGGVLFRPSGFQDLHNLTVAGAVRNLGTKLRFISERAPLPAEASLSLAYDAHTADWRFLPALEVAVPYAGNVYGKAGLEATRKVSAGMSVAMRLGYTSVSTIDLGIMSGVTGGVGLKIGMFSFDAAFQPMALLGESFRIGVGWKF